MNSDGPDLHRLRARIADATRRYGRSPASVSLLAVSKTRTVSEILKLASRGQRLFGENYLQEAQPKLRMLAGQGLEWHFIGHIQSNKTAEIACLFSWVHGLDRERVAARLNDHRPPHLPPLNVCIQVNVSAEPTKSGVAPTELPRLARIVSHFPRLRLRGLMALPAPDLEVSAKRQSFRELAEAFRDLRDGGLDLDTLSMGTSEDFEAALAEGATLVRIGAALFGPRPSKATPVGELLPHDDRKRTS